jgi:hypothetical protein
MAGITLGEASIWHRVSRLSSSDVFGIAIVVWCSYCDTAPAPFKKQEMCNDFVTYGSKEKGFIFFTVNDSRLFTV